MPDMRLRRHANIPVMKPTDDRNRNQFGRSHNRFRLLIRNRRIAIEPLMRAGYMIILVDVFPQKPV